ncbi:MAG TPA: DHHA1 domain-containing protein, partial [Parasegetibacter sp.]
SGDLVAGSARSISGFNLYEAIHACKDHLLGYGGHYAAAGMTLKPESVEAFSLAFENEVRRTVPDELFIPEILIDSEINFEEITPTFFNIIKQMEPFGPENPKPTFLARNVIDTGASKVVKENHLRIVLKQGNNCLAGIGFNLAPRYEILAGGRPADILFTLEENVWNGNRSIQIRLIDIRPAEQS